MQVKYFSPGETSGRAPLQCAPAAQPVCVGAYAPPTSQQWKRKPDLGVPNQTVPLSGKRQKQTTWDWTANWTLIQTKLTSGWEAGGEAQVRMIRWYNRKKMTGCWKKRQQADLTRLRQEVKCKKTPEKLIIIINNYCYYNFFILKDHETFWTSSDFGHSFYLAVYCVSVN